MVGLLANGCAHRDAPGRQWHARFRRALATTGNDAAPALFTGTSASWFEGLSPEQRRKILGDMQVYVSERAVGVAKVNGLRRPMVAPRANAPDDAQDAVLCTTSDTSGNSTMDVVLVREGDDWKADIISSIVWRMPQNEILNSKGRTAVVWCQTYYEAIQEWQRTHEEALRSLTSLGSIGRWLEQRDPWGSPYYLDRFGAARGDFRIGSAGPDRVRGTDDDVVYPIPVGDESGR